MPVVSGYMFIMMPEEAAVDQLLLPMVTAAQMLLC